ncbi:MAG TPA: malto-oligosyltrehalose synthase [Casimicrobiaceae bacterium]|nr:malto-oligosyltrehalose synthase [Casimicrobiaceae bacterium]
MTAIPRATYRVQLHKDFNFRAAREIVPYLARLGISHLYTSPFLKARTGSRHGYDIVDHQSLNPEIGTQEDFDALVCALHDHGMGLLIDVVPNHMGVLEADNAWWLDVMEHGPASRYAGYFDIDWDPLSEELRGKVLLPILGAQYGTVLERGELKLAFDREAGAFNLWYYEHRLPVRPSTYPMVLLADPGDETDPVDAMADHWPMLGALAEGFALLAAPAERSDPAQLSAPLKHRLASLCSEIPAVGQWIDARVQAINGVAGDASSFDTLHALIKEQFYRVSYWRVAADDINYRRFFDINGLAALRQERPEVFEATHRRIFEWIAQRKVDALRIDHPDGLLDPHHYCSALQQRAGAALGSDGGRDARGDGREQRPIYLVLEKILADHEKLAETWPVHGTTGYRYMNVVNGLFVDVGAREIFDRIYQGFIGEDLVFDAVLRQSKTLIAAQALASDLNLLTEALTRIAKSARDTCDFTLNSLRRALVDMVACLPVYRTYVAEGRFPADACKYIDWAAGVAKRSSPAAETSVYDFVRDILTGRQRGGSKARREAIDRFIGRFQQFTAPVMAKGMEDTSFYAYVRLAALNEVGGDPRRFGFSLEAFHTASQDRARHWPHTMLATSTHDNKRSEDVRTRIDVLSEMPATWRATVRRWRDINRRLRDSADRMHAPSRNDEYLLYQTLLGSWPIESMDAESLAVYRERIQQYMLKAAREAKTSTSWINPNEPYEAALRDFVDGLLGSLSPNPFLADLVPLAQRIARYGALNSLSQTLIKLTSPGVPDTYQGTELWELSLVDPDNRRPVDYRRRVGILEQLARDFVADDTSKAVRSLLDRWTDGRVKLWLMWRVLALRKQHAQWFERAGYQPLAVQGARAGHLCAFARPYEGAMLVTLAPRLFVGLGEEGWPLGESVWRDTRVILPARSPSRWRDALTGVRHVAQESTDATSLRVGAILDAFPGALLMPQ